MRQTKESKISITGTPRDFCNAGRAKVPNTAPALATAAAKPAPLARIEVGNTSPESRNVVELGPAFIIRLKMKNPLKTRRILVVLPVDE
jgi:hypothetical protein